MKIDPWKHKERYLKWKEKVKDKIPDISKENSEIVLRYLNDMEKGLNVATGSLRGPRTFSRLFTIKEKMIFFARRFDEVYGVTDLTKVSEDQIITFFADMRNGTIKRVDGKQYTSLETQGKVFKAFWHWHQKVNRKLGIKIPDITIDLDSRTEKPKWVYLTEEEIRKLCDEARHDYKVMMMFVFDTGIRSPTELMNVKVSDFFNDLKELKIREEVSKTFGRRIKLMLCSDLIKEYVKTQNLESNDYLFSICPQVVNRYLKRLAKRVLGDKVTPAGESYSKLSLYDFRHNSCCYWLPRYKSESALKYRFGWKKSEKIHYYSEFLGMRDTISEEDMLVDITKTEIEKQLVKSENEKEILKERVDVLEKQMKVIAQLVKKGVMIVRDES
jgi:integrase